MGRATREEADISQEAGAVGCTQNPSYVYKMLVHDREKVHAYKKLDTILKRVDDDNLAQEMLQQELVGEVARKFLPLYEQSNGKYGYVSI